MDLASSAIRVEKESVWLNWVVAKKRLGWLAERHEVVALILTGIRAGGTKRRKDVKGCQRHLSQSLRGARIVVDSRFIMFCPQCKAEYRQGFTRCADCDVDLVDALPAEEGSLEEGDSSPSDLSDASLEKVWDGDDQTACVSICKSLHDANIPYLVRERNQQFFWTREQKFEILVSRSNSQAALEIANTGTVDFTDSEEDQAIMEIPARDDLPIQEVHGDWNSSSWFPEDATLEIWSGDRKDWSSTIEMSLKENRINFRPEKQWDSGLKIFVMPEDETRAREIVREIVEGAPPE